MTEIPSDIILKADELFPVPAENKIVKNIMEEILKRKINVGHAQLLRSMLILSDGHLAKFQNIVESDFLGDPRDVIMKAEEKLGKPGHYFADGF